MYLFSISFKLTWCFKLRYCSRRLKSTWRPWLKWIYGIKKGPLDFRNTSLSSSSISSLLLLLLCYFYFCLLLVFQPRKRGLIPSHSLVVRCHCHWIMSAFWKIPLLFYCIFTQSFKWANLTFFFLKMTSLFLTKYRLEIFQSVRFLQVCLSNG